MEKATNEILQQRLQGRQSELERVLRQLHPRAFSEYVNALSEARGRSKSEGIR